MQESFARGAVLLDGSGRTFMVHTSHRTAAGQAGIHARDTDIIYVLDGSATFVTGGTAVDHRQPLTRGPWDGPGTPGRPFAFHLLSPAMPQDPTLQETPDGQFPCV